MKLTSLAALLVRIIGALMVMSAVYDIFGSQFDPEHSFSLVDGFLMLVVSLLTIRFSKKIAEVFCRGLE